MADHTGKVPVKKRVTRNGVTYEETFWVSPQEAKAQKQQKKQETPKSKRTSQAVEQPKNQQQKDKPEQAPQSPKRAPAKPGTKPRPEQAKQKQQAVGDISQSRLDVSAGHPVKIPSGRKWIDSVPGFPTETWNLYFDKDPNKGGKPTPQRKQLHDAIIAKFSDQTKPIPLNQTPRVVMMMGGPASGKTHITGGVDRSNMVSVDPDAIKDQMPEYQHAVSRSAKNAAFMAHEESSYIAKKIRDKAIAERKNLLIDGTGKNAHSYLEVMARLKQAGYHVTVLMPDSDVADGLVRAKARAEKTGRYVPDDIIKSAYEKIPKNFQRIAAQADSFHVFNGRKKPAPLVWSKVDGKEEIHDKEFVEDFKRKYG